MADQTQASISTATIGGDALRIDGRDRSVLRGLARSVAELAARPVEDEKRRLWYDHNALRPTRPLIFCDPENGWNEIITERDLACNGGLARDWEFTLRKEIFWGSSMGDDRVVEPFFNVPYVHEETDWGMHETKIGGRDGGSYVWEAPLATYDDFHRLAFPRILVDRGATDRLVALAEETLGDILTVRLRGTWWWTLGMTWTLVNIRGLERIMYDVFDYPEDLKRLMSFLRDGTLAKLDFLEENGLLSLNNDGAYVGSGGFGWTDELPCDDFNGSGVRTADMWGFCESQETSSWSPEMFGEFILPYQLPVLERFGLNCYGCCEALDKRWSFIEKVPRLRRVSVSPWADRGDMADKLGDRYIYSLKPIPTDLAVPVIDEDRIRRGLRETVRICRDNRLEIIMKDNHTIGGNPDNVVRWCRIAREEADLL
ncbi:MAG: hypothetical protein J7M24_03910 [Candidatus Latescibacteria bacterium]|nr:hypothetical protein [Candidatus Latescibacterota bacterium]